jgi:dihydrofolate synthase/folylpolyglutamate synthase
MRVLADTIPGLFPGRRIILVIAMLSDKDVAQSLRILREIGDSIVISQSTYERALAAQKLMNVAREAFPNPFCEQTLSAALEKAISLSSPDDIILVAGSLFNVAEVKEYVSARIPKQAAPQS